LLVGRSERDPSVWLDQQVARWRRSDGVSRRGFDHAAAAPEGREVVSPVAKEVLGVDHQFEGEEGYQLLRYRRGGGWGLSGSSILADVEKRRGEGKRPSREALGSPPPPPYLKTTYIDLGELAMVVQVSNISSDVIPEGFGREEGYQLL